LLWAGPADLLRHSLRVLISICLIYFTFPSRLAPVKSVTSATDSCMNKYEAMSVCVREISVFFYYFYLLFFLIYHRLKPIDSINLLGS
jgi:hypothetical protein